MNCTPLLRECHRVYGDPLCASNASIRRQRPVSVCSSRAGTVINSVRSISDANFPVDQEGRTYHVGAKPGEIANQVLSVGSVDRAQRISELLKPLSPGKPLFKLMSSRGFLTITGKYEGVPISIISTHMGLANMDFVVREARAVVQGELAIVRFGTCGAIQPPAKLGDLLVASHGSVCIRRNPDAFNHQSTELPYTLSLPVPADPTLSRLLELEAARQVGAENVVAGLNATADSFYSSQGRIGAHFDDRNENLFIQLLTKYPDAVSLEMETFQLLDLARCSVEGSIKAAAFCIALAERYSNKFIDYARVQELEEAGGRAALSALACYARQGKLSEQEATTGTSTRHV